MTRMATPVLKVDVSGRPLGFIPWDEFVCLYWKGKCRILEAEKDSWRSPSTDIPKAIIVQVEHYVRLKPLRDNYIPKRILFNRDSWECQYCSKPITMATGTKDHVKPRHSFKKQGLPVAAANTWCNVVTSCQPCNHKKGNQTCAQAGMYPKNTPKKPEYIQTVWNKVHHPVQQEYVASYYQINPDTLTVLDITDSR